ncbi:hypothetical protein LGL82_11240, partial [Escherichia coli]|nr:hypothetical protein [Escherichia coli]
MTSAAITMTAPEAASPVQMYRATYSPDDNKLRLYAVSRLDPETYKKVHDAGFRWAPKQALFVAPAWTPGREDVLLSLAGEIEDEDSTLAERQEARAERFLLFPAALILTTAVLSCLPGAPSAPGCLAASGRQARLRQAAAGAPASLRRTRWRGFGLSLRS